MWINSFSQQFSKNPQIFLHLAKWYHVVLFNPGENGNQLGKIVCGGKSDKSKLYIAPTIIVDPNEQSTLCQEEVFGPLLAIRGFDTIDQAIEYANNKEKPLVTYFYGAIKSKNCERVLRETSSGAFVTNECIM